MAGARLGGADPGGRLLAAELDNAWRAYGVPVLSALARIHFGGRCARTGAHGKFNLDDFAEKFCADVCGIGSGVVVVRAD